MSEPSKHRRKKKLPDNVTELEDKEVAKLLFGKKAARELEKEIEKSDRSDKK